MKIIYISLIMLLFISCEKDMEIDIPKSSPKLVVNSIFNPDSSWAVVVSQSLQISTPDSLVNYISNAIVTISDSTGRLIEKLQYNNKAYKSVLGNKPVVNGKYQINVESEGFEKVTAKSYIPDTNKLENIAISKGLSIDKRYNQMADFLLFEATLKDNPKTADYYFVEFVGFNNYDNSLEKFEIEGNDNFFESFSSTVTQQFRVYFSDETFNGQEKKIKLKSNIGSLGFYSLPPDFYPTLYIRLYSVSAQLYNYLVTYYRQSESSEYEYTNQPIRVENNIVNGLGIFGGYSYKDILIDNQTIATALE